MSSSFAAKLAAAVARNRSLLCVGLDPDPFQFPQFFRHPVDAESLAAWGKAIVEQTADLVCCYKPNIAFYEQFGLEGLEALQRTLAVIPGDIPVLLDAKRGDIGSTATAYARAAFEVLGVDAVTVSPYLGQDAVAPFLGYAGKAVFVLCYTSNPSAAAVQEFGDGQTRLFEHIVNQATQWGEPDQIGFVVGATQPEALARVRRLLAGRPHWILAPGVGAQGGDLAEALAAGLDDHGSGLIVPVSRHIICADSPRAAALALRDEINQARTSVGKRAAAPVKRPPDPLVDLILHLHDAGCVRLGEFTLASGLRSPIYIDLRRMASEPSLLRQAAQAYAGLLGPLRYERLAAVPYAALTIGTAVALATDSSLIYPRKEVKAYGTGQAVEGVFAPGDRVVVIEDLVTSGGSVIKAIETLEAAGLVVQDVAVLIDRQQGGPEALAAAGYRLHAVLTMTQILDVLQSAGRISFDQANAVKGYLSTTKPKE